MQHFNEEFLQKAENIVEPRESSDTELIEHIVDSNGGFHLICGSLGSGKVYFANLILKKLNELGIYNVKNISCREYSDLVEVLKDHKKGEHVLVVIDSFEDNPLIGRLMNNEGVNQEHLMNVKSITTSSIENEPCECSDPYSCTNCNGSGKKGANIVLKSIYANLAQLSPQSTMFHTEIALIHAFKEGEVSFPNMSSSTSEKVTTYLLRDLIVDTYRDQGFELSQGFTALVEKLTEMNISISPILEHAYHGWLHGELSYKQAVLDSRFLLR